MEHYRIKIRRGLKEDLPLLEEGELALADAGEDGHELWIGTRDGNVLINTEVDKNFIENILIDSDLLLKIGETELDAYRGDFGKIAYEHSEETGNAHNMTFSEILDIPTTIAGYGITDGYTKNEVDTKFDEFSVFNGNEFELESLGLAEKEGDAFGSKQLSLISSYWNIIQDSGPTFVASSPELGSGNQGLAFSSDGSKLFTIESTNDKIHQFNLSIPFDISSISLPATYSIDVTETNPYGLFFKNDGTALFYVGSASRRVFKRVLSTPWDISTAGNEIESPQLPARTYQGLFFNPSGTRLYIIDSTDDEIKIFRLSSSWDITTMSTSTIGNINILNEESSPTGLFISPDGMKLFIVGSNSDFVHEYTMDTAWGTSATYTGRKISVLQNSTNDITFKPDGTVMYLIGSTTRKVDAFNIPSAFSLESQTTEKEIKGKFKLKTTTIGSSGSKLEVTYNTDNLPAESIFEITTDGRITKGTIPFNSITNKPSTIAGYGITNVYTKSEVDNLNIIPPPPTVDGVYVLQVSVVDGIPSYNWIQQ
jgi:hypothetical protein